MGIRNPEKNQDSTNDNRRIPLAFGVQNAVRLIKKRHEKLIIQLSARLRSTTDICKGLIGQVRSYINEKPAMRIIPRHTS